MKTLHKITTGFVTQVFDTETGKYVSQNFTAGTDVDYEDPFGNILNPVGMEQYNFGPYAASEPYLPFDMVQPTTELSIPLRSCREQIQEDLLVLCEAFGFSDKIKTLACQIVVDNFKKI